MPTPRDRHIEMIAAKGRMGSQKACGCGQRSLVASGMLRHKISIGRTLRARTPPAQKVEASIACKIFNPHDRPWRAGLQKGLLSR